MQPYQAKEAVVALLLLLPLAVPLLALVVVAWLMHSLQLSKSARTKLVRVVSISCSYACMLIY